MLQMHRLELCWTQKEQILAECQAETKKLEFQADYDRSVRKLGELIESQQEERTSLRSSWRTSTTRSTTSS